MPIISYLKPGTPPGSRGLGIRDCRVRETVALSSTTSAAAQDGEFAVVGNTESSMILVARGTTPDAAATAATSDTTAGFPLAAGQVSDPIAMAAGDKISVKAIS